MEELVVGNFVDDFDVFVFGECGELGLIVLNDDFFIGWLGVD